MTTILILLGEGLVCYLLLRVVDSFGAYTESIREGQQAIRDAQETGLIVHAQTLQILRDINRSQPSEQGNQEKSA